MYVYLRLSYDEQTNPHFVQKLVKVICEFHNLHQNDSDVWFYVKINIWRNGQW